MDDIVCPKCNQLIGRMYWEDKVRHIELYGMRSIRQSDFECIVCESRFTVYLTFTGTGIFRADDVVDAKFKDDIHLLKDS